MEEGEGEGLGAEEMEGEGGLDWLGWLMGTGVGLGGGVVASSAVGGSDVLVVVACDASSVPLGDPALLCVSSILSLFVNSYSNEVPLGGLFCIWKNPFRLCWPLLDCVPLSDFCFFIGFSLGVLETFRFSGDIPGRNSDT